MSVDWNKYPPLPPPPAFPEWRDTPGIWLSRRILSQIEVLSTTLNSTSEGALIYGSKRRRGN